MKGFNTECNLLLFCFVMLISEATKTDSFFPTTKLMCETSALLCQSYNNTKALPSEVSVR